jgi:citrate synthase
VRGNKLFFMQIMSKIPTSTVRMVGSSHAGLFASTSEFQLVGTSRRGKQVLEMLEEIKMVGWDKYMAKAK